MGKDRLKRLLILLLVVGFLLIGVKVFADWQNKKKAAGETTNLPNLNLGGKISNLGEQILGKAVETLPGNNVLKQKIITEKETSSTNTETEKVERVEIKTQEIIEIIKELPAEQMENIKKQVFKDFCQKILEEENGGD